MINFLKSIALLIVSLIVFSLVIALGLPLSIWAFIFSSDKQGFDNLFKYLWGIINGFFNALAYIIESFAIGYDILANALGGQGLEYLITKERDTYLGSGEHTISAAIGDLTRRKSLLPNGKRLVKLLNWSFNEDNHGEYSLRQKELNEEFEKSIPKQR